jgi:hypothetical protein
MKYSVSHDLGQATARKVADAAFASYQAKLKKYHPETRWVSDTRAEISFSVKGITLRGALEVSPTAIDMELDVPFLFRPFQSLAMGVVQDEIRGWVEKARAGQI